MYQLFNMKHITYLVYEAMYKLVQHDYIMSYYDLAKILPKTKSHLSPHMVYMDTDPVNF